VLSRPFVVSGGGEGGRLERRTDGTQFFSESSAHAHDSASKQR
jgi:hypothetical protein